MSERFQSLYRIPSNQCAEGCPIVIEEGALLKDTNNGRVLAQLKLKNISSKEVVACKVRIRAYEPNGNEIEGKQADYLDICAKSGVSFGSKQAVYIPNGLARRIETEVIETVFADGSTWYGDGARWGTLSEQQSLSDALGDTELCKQISLELGEGCKYMPVLKKGIFQCTCGAVYLEKDGECYRCHRTVYQLTAALEPKGLRARTDARLRAEAEERMREQEERERLMEEQRIRAAESRRKHIRIAKIVVPVLAVVVATTAVYTQVILPKQRLDKAIELIENGNFSQGYAELQAMGKAELAAEPQYLKYANIGDKFVFGAYEQDNDAANGKEPIEWRILDKSDHGFLVISEYALNFYEYNVDVGYTDKVAQWEISDVRKWLNGAFLNNAFSDEEQGRVLIAYVPGSVNPKYGTTSGNATHDSIFLLSMEEAEKYFNDNVSRVCRMTEYSKSRVTYGIKGACRWWLRSSGMNSSSVVDVGTDGYIDIIGIRADYQNCAVRPAFWISI